MTRNKVARSGRLHASQLHTIEKVRKLRSEATALREQVSSGSYEDNELRRFYRLAEVAATVLDISNSELSTRVELGDAFFPTLLRDRRSPKLQNFLRALTSMIEVANERLFDVDRAPSAPSDDELASSRIAQRIEQDSANLLLLSRSLAKLSLDEIDRLRSEWPNDPDRQKDYERQYDLLKILADGFVRIADALSSPDLPINKGKAVVVVENVAQGFSRWWGTNEAEAIDWAVRIPVLAAGVAALGWAGANMVVGTTAVAALVGGKRVLKALNTRRARKPKK